MSNTSGGIKEFIKKFKFKNSDSIMGWWRSRQRSIFSFLCYLKVVFFLKGGGDHTCVNLIRSQFINHPTQF